VSEEQTNAEVWPEWKAPEKPSEALKLGEDYATMEGLWCKGSLLELRHELEHRLGDFDFVHQERFKGMTENASDQLDGDDYDQFLTCYCERCVRLRAVRDKTSKQGLTCGEVKACAIGILIMAIFDGPVVGDYLSMEGEPTVDPEDLLIKDRIGAHATIFLAAGLKKAAKERSEDATILGSRDFMERLMEGPRDRRLSLDKWRENLAENAKDEVITFNDLNDSESHHDAIVLGFRYGLEFAEQYESALGFGAPVEPIDPPAQES
jgi:hypothetical protein